MSVWSDVGNGLAAGASTAGNAVEGGVDTACDGAEAVVIGGCDAAEAGTTFVSDAVDTATGASNGGGPAATAVTVVVNVVLGVVDGVLDFVKAATHSGFESLRDIGGIFGGLLRGDFGYAAGRFIDLLGQIAFGLLLILRVLALGYFVGAIVRRYKRDALRRFVEGLLASTFGQPQLGAIRRRLRLTGGGIWGLRLAATHKVCMFDSDHTPLWSLHQDGSLDLYALAGLWSSDTRRNSGRIYPHDCPTSVVMFVHENGSETRATRFGLSRYINDPKHPGRIRVYAMSRRAIAQKLRMARVKCEEIGVRLSWNDSERFYLLGQSDTHEITTTQELNFSGNGDNTYFADRGLRTGTAGDDCTPLALGIFNFAPGNFGLVVGRDDLDSKTPPEPCPTGGRTDGCCMVIKRRTDGPPPAALGSAVVHRDFWPTHFARFILAHELGHYFGLCHKGNETWEHIMFSNAAWKASGRPVPLSGTPPFYWHDEPIFTLENGKNAWRFIVQQMPHCL